MPAPDTAGSQLNSSAVSLLKGETEGESCSRSTRHSQAHEAGLEDWQKPRNAEQMSRSSLTISGKKSQGCSPLRTFPQSPLLFYPIRGEALKPKCLYMRISLGYWFFFIRLLSPTPRDSKPSHFNWTPEICILARTPGIPVARGLGPQLEKD